MPIEIYEVGPESLDRYATIPIAFEVRTVLRPILVDDGLSGIALGVEPVDVPYIKDYDAYGEGRPQDWAEEFDVSRWGFLLAVDEDWQDMTVGGAAIAFDTPGVHMLAERDNLGILWDIRVHPSYRGQGIGSALFARAAKWCRHRGCDQMKIETQNVNVPARRFYRSQGAKLGEINQYAYAGHPHVSQEVMLVWYLDLRHTWDFPVQ
ncbi:MAG: GNAT family N-acetyltransferase [Anaerolineae bacterium]